MPFIRQTRSTVSALCTAAILAGLAATTGARAATHDDPQATDPRERLTAEARIVDDAPPQRILEIRDSDDGTLGTVVFGRGDGPDRSENRRGPR